MRGGSRLRTVMHEKESSGTRTKPITLMDHPNPRFVLFSIFESAIGMTMPWVVIAARRLADMVSMRSARVELLVTPSAETILAADPT